MLPTRLEAEKELEAAGQLNPGPWIAHSLNTGLAAQYIAEKCEGLDPERAYILGILHDIGRRVGIVSLSKHVYEGYQYALSKGWNDVAKICMTHSYLIKESDFEEYIQEDEEKFIQSYIKQCHYDDYDQLIQLCDSLASQYGFCLLEKRFVDVVRRYGFWDTTIERWNKTFEIKMYFEKKIGCSIYEILTGVKETTFIEGPVDKSNLRLKLISPTEAYRAEWYAIIKEIEEAEEKITPLALKGNTTNYTKYLSIIENNSKGINLPSHIVPSELYFLVEEGSKRILGSIDIRRELNEYLYTYGGNIGYGIRPSERKKGYATQMLRLALERCKTLGMDQVLITCFKDNVGSAKTILNNGGILENEVMENGILKQRYWITLAK